MKRTISLILSLTLILSSFSLFAFSSNAQPAATDTVTYTFLKSVDESGEVHLEGTLRDFKLGSMNLTVPFKIDATDKAVSVEAKVLFLNLRILYLNGKFYVMIPALRLYASVDRLGSYGSVIESLLFRVRNEAKVFAQDFYVGSTASGVTYNGGTYDMEEIVEYTSSPSFSAKVYYNQSKEIKGVYAKKISPNLEFNIDIDSAAARVNSENLVFPTFYFNFTPVVMFIFYLLIGKQLIA